jgi:hypothetical protein
MDDSGRQRQQATRYERRAAPVFGSRWQELPQTQAQEVQTPRQSGPITRQPKTKSITLNLHLRRPPLPRHWLRNVSNSPWARKFEFVARFFNEERRLFIRLALSKANVRVSLVVMVLVVVGGDIVPIFQDKLTAHTYALGSANSLLSAANQPMADKLKYDAQKQVYNFNEGYSPTPQGTLGSAGPQISASANQDPAKGITVTDPTNSIDFTLTPKFNLLPGKQDGNRVVYPLTDNSGWVVYTMHGIGVKEDVILNRAGGDSMTFDYKLSLGNQLVARIQKNGSIGIYGSTLLSGNVATGSDSDAALLQKARDKAPKNTLLFDIPAPTIKQLNNKKLDVKASYAIQGDTLSVKVTGLKDAAYPITIDPSIYVETAEKFMNGNNDTNIDFDVADTLIQKGKTTGARFDSWQSMTSMNSAQWRQGVAVAGGYIYTVGGLSFNGQIFTTQGADTYTVPSGVTSLTVKVWGGGGGGGGGAATAAGAAGGGAGYTTGVISVSTGQVLNVYVGGGGTGGSYSAGGNDAGGGGGGGGYSSIYRSGTPLAIAAGGGGAGGARNATVGGAGGPGGCTATATSCNGTTVGDGGAGGGATTAAGGSAGSGGNNSGTAGSSLTGGAGADGRNAQGTDGSGAAGGLATGGDGGQANINTTRAGGGGGGAGNFGGGGGGATSSTNGSAGGGAGGGSNYTDAGLTSVTNNIGSAATPGNSGDAFRNGAGNGGGGGAALGNGTAGSTGIVVISVTGSTSVNSSGVNWAKFNTTTGSIDSANPGNGACSGWCTATAYNLPAPRSNMSLVAYNGFLYAIGGEDSSCTTGNGTGDNGVCKTVYIAKLGANGEPRLWHPSGGTQVYWYRDTDLSSPRSFAGAVAYNNRMYLLGGKTSASSVASVVTTVEEADITGPGNLSSWTTTGMVTLRDPANNANPLARYGFGVQAYNDHIYVIGGASSLTTGSPSGSSQYITLNSDGTMAGNWLTTTSFSTGRMTNGGNFTAVWGAYIYLIGGCTAYNASGYCTTVASDVQLASINTDGSLDTWNTDANVTDTRMGHNVVAWRNVIYEIGGCSAQNTSTGDCTTTLSTINCGADVNGNCGINQDGDASTVGSSVASGTAPCSGGTPTSCNLPSASVGNVLNETAIMNGYLYIMGGCTNNGCTTASSGVTYQAIASDGTLQKPATCPGGTFTDSYCVSPNTLPVGLGAGATTVFNGRIYIVGGFNTGTNIYYTTVNTDGSIAAWTTNANISSVTGAVVTTLTYSYAFTRANPSAVASTPGNLFIFGGCTDGSVGCSNYSNNVFKCNIGTTGAISSCTRTGQLQITNATDPNNGNADCGAGLGAMAGAVYANYIYLVGGLTPNCTDLRTARYAKIDNSNNVVTVGTGWVQGLNQTATGRRRGAGFGYNGYLYVVGGYDGTSGVLADIEFAKIDVSTGLWGAWHVSSVTINQRWGLTVPVSNSYAYVVGGCTAGAAPSSCTTRTNTTQTFQIYNNDSGTVANLTSAADDTFVNSTDRVGASAAILNGFVYVVGGCTASIDCSANDSTREGEYAPISAGDGSIGTWSALTGNISTVTSGDGRGWGGLVVIGNALHFVGGLDDARNGGSSDAKSAVYSAVPNTSTGDIASWTTDTPLGTGSAAGVADRARVGVAAWNGRIYVVAGNNDTLATPRTTIYVSNDVSSGGQVTGWTSTTDLTVARRSPAVTAYANNLYVFGGDDGTNYLNDSQYAQITGYKTGTISQTGTTITGSGTTFQLGQVGDTLTYSDGSATTITGFTNTTTITVAASKTVSSGSTYRIDDGAISSWTYTTSLPSPISGGNAFAANGYMYIVAGKSATSTCSSSVLVAPISANTTIASGNVPTGVGEWYQTNVSFTGSRFGTAVAYSGGKFYMMGGGCTAPLSSSRHYYASLNSQPQIAKYSIMFDTDSDVFPQKWLLNGVDNSIGAQWQLSYRSMKNTTSSCAGSAMTTWGQTTNFGNVTLGTPGVYTPKDGSGTNTNCARFFYLSVSIDASQTFGYPDDVSRGPTITDLTLEFTADPSKRLMHGRTFTGGLQQPDDTPF